MCGLGLKARNRMSFAPIVESLAARQQAKDNRGFILASWALICFVCLFLWIPSFGLGSLFIVGPMLFISLVMGTLTLARGQILPGLTIVITSLIAAPVSTAIAPFVSSSLGFSRMVAGSGNAAEIGKQPSASETTPSPSSEIPDGTSQATEYEQLKTQLQGQSEQLAALKATQLLVEGAYGYLAGDERLNIEQRHLVQQENVWRERIFDLMGQRTGRSREEIAAIFFKMTQRSSVNVKSTPPNHR
jgi:hypothetical protein